MTGFGALTLSAGAAVVFAAPGPTNVILCNAGACLGFRRALRLALAELIGYSITVPLLYAMLDTVGGSALEISRLLHILCGILLTALASRIWLAASLSNEMTLGFGEILVATVANPKAILLLALLPPGLRIHSVSAILSFLLLILPAAICGSGWIMAGVLLRRGALRKSGLHLINRASSVILGLLGAGMIVSAL